MSRASSPRAARLRHWPKLLKAIADEHTRSPCQPDLHDQHRYLHALEKALDGRDTTALHALLAAGVPMLPVLLPVVGEVILDLQQGRSNGRPASLTLIQQIAIRDAFNQYTASGMPAGEAHVCLGVEYGVHEDTIKRYLKKLRRGN